MISKYLTLVMLLSTALHVEAQTVSDFDGNIYNTIVIGTQTWTKENLKTTRFNNGTVIPTTTLSVNNDSTSVFQWPYNNDTLNVAVYGRLYTWYAITRNENVCPVGWHVPDNTDWETLSNFLGGDSLAGKEMKETGTLHWSSTNASVSNSSDFTALPGGFRGNPSGFNVQGTNACFWSRTPFGSAGFQRGFWYGLDVDDNILSNAVAVSNCGKSVRCVKDVSTGIRSQSPQTEMLLSPNPASTELTVEFENAESRDLYIYSVQGALVDQMRVSGKTTKLSLEKLEKGVYVLKIVSKGIATERKFVKD